MIDLTGIEPLNAADYAARLKRAGERIAAAGLAGLVVGGPANLRYFTGRGGNYCDRFYGLVVRRDGTVLHVCPAFEEGRIREGLAKDAEVLTWQENENPCALIAKRMEEVPGPLGLEDTMPLWYCEKFRAAARQGVADGSDVMRRLRACKTQRELALMRRSNEIIGDAVREAFSQAREGMTNLEMNDLVAAACTRRGVKGGSFVLFGAAAAFPHGTKYPQRLQKGDVMLCDAGCVVEGYVSDITRSVVYGAEPTARQRLVWDTLKEAQAAALAAARPGAPLAAPDNAAREVLRKAGFGGDYETFTHRLGHGIGLEGHEWPYLCRGDEMPMEEGMTFSNEPGIYIPGDIGMRLEDCIYITKDGAEYFAATSTSILEV